MPYNSEDLKKAQISLNYFREHCISPHHERYSFPFLRGSYFAYRKVDVLRIVSIANAISTKPTLLDIGCGYGDFLKKIREFIPKAQGLEKDPMIYYHLPIAKPDFIRIADARWGIEQAFDIIFVGWMDPGVDFRDAIKGKSDVVITTLDQGLSLAAEFDGHGYWRIASWRTPSWEDVNTEIMNRYYTGMSEEKYHGLSLLRGAHNLWYIYCSKEQKSEIIKVTLKEQIEWEKNAFEQWRYDFEQVLDECGFGYHEKVKDFISGKEERLWEIHFDSI
jgi:hypothetical protein